MSGDGAATSVEPTPGTEALAPDSLERATNRPLWLHALILGFLVACFVALSHPGRPLSSDEGASLAQAQILRDDGTWFYEYPLAWLDGARDASPFVRGSVGTQGVAPYAKHPLYPLLLWGVGSGAGGALALSVTGTTIAALLAALIARRLSDDPMAPTLALWSTGLATPLLFDAGLALAHSMAAAAVAGAVLLGLRSVSSLPPRRFGGWAAVCGATVLALVASMLRTESVLVFGAFALAFVAVGRSRSSCLVAIALAGGAIGAVILDRLALAAIVGQSLPTPGNSGSSGLLGRWDGFYVTWLAGTYRLRTPAGTALWLAFAAVALGAVLLRLRAIRPIAFGWVTLVGAAAYGLRALVDPAVVIPGLLVTVPVLGTMAWFVSPRDRSRQWSIAGLGCVFGTLAVLGTQYSIGGGVEWGGRYFAVLLPVGAAVLVSGSLPTLRTTLPAGGARRVVVLAAIATTTVLAGLALATLRNAHQEAEVLSDRIATAAYSGDGAADGAIPIVLTPNRLLPQLLHQDLDRYGWVSASSAVLPDYAEQLAASGVDRAVLVAPGAQELVKRLPGGPSAPPRATGPMTWS